MYDSVRAMRCGWTRIFIESCARRPTRLRVAAVIEELRPAIQEDDGDVELVDVTPEGQVQVRFKGACVRCPSSGMTLHGGIEKNLRAIVPEVESVISVQ
jgi:Fe-S cluster biogenesis protein NfuA